MGNVKFGHLERVGIWFMEREWIGEWWGEDFGGFTIGKFGRGKFYLREETECFD